MEPRINLITLGVADLARSRRFYRDGLGFPTTWTGDKGIVFFKTTGVCLALYPFEELAKDVSDSFVTEKLRFGGITLAHNVRQREDVDRILKMVRIGAAFSVARVREIGYSFAGIDPSGLFF